jgi:prolyl-tRNA synthetase
MCALPVMKDVAVAGVTDQLAAASMMDEDNIVLSTLADLSHQVYSHVLCKTAEELVANVPIPDTDSHTKNLLFKDKKHGMFLIVLATKSHLDTKALGTMLGLAGKVHLRLADEATLDASLGVKPGCVGPLCIVNDKDQQIKIVLDEALMNVENVHFHPLRNDMSVIMEPNDLKDYIIKTGHEVTMLEFGMANDAATPAPASGAATKPPKPAPAPKAAKKVDPNKKVTIKGETLLALQWKKSENFSMWYSDVIVLSEMISYYDISGCYILRPWSYKIWGLITAWFNGEVSPPPPHWASRRCCLLGIIHSHLCLLS